MIDDRLRYLDSMMVVLVHLSVSEATLEGIYSLITDHLDLLEDEKQDIYTSVVDRLLYNRMVLLCEINRAGDFTPLAFNKNERWQGLDSDQTWLILSKPGKELMEVLKAKLPCPPSTS